MKALEKLDKTRECLDYIEEHLLNIEKAWGVVKDKCKDMRFIYDDFLYWSLDAEVKNHDISKLSSNELTQYRDYFFPVDGEEKKSLGDAWENHKKENNHHWQTWTNIKESDHIYAWEVNCAHMIVDWMAMSYKFGGTAREYYESNKKKIKLPDYAVKFIYEIFDRVYN